MKVMENTTNKSYGLTKIIKRVTTDMTDIYYNFTTKVDDYTRFSGENNDGTISTTKSATTTSSTTTTTTTTTIENTPGTTAAAAAASSTSSSPLSTLPTATITTTTPTTTSIPLELFKLITTDEPENITTNTSICTKLPLTTTTTEEPFDEFGPPEGLEYIFVPLGVMIFVIILSGVVLIISRRRKLEILKSRLMPLYHLEPGESGEDDWETELLDESLSGGRQRRQGYQSMDNDESAELFTH